MKQQLSALYEVQTLDSKIASIKAHIASLDGAMELKKKLASAKAALVAYDKKLHDMERELRSDELELKSIDSKRANCEKRLYDGIIKNAKELSATQKEIQAMKDAQSKLDGRILELYDAIEERKNKIAHVQEVAGKIENKIAEVLTKQEQHRKKYDCELTELQNARNEAVTHVTDKQLLARYDLIRKKTGETAIAKVIDNKCEGCHVGVMQFVTRKLFEDNELVSCENCGRILMLDTK